jgi:tetratricopeptide (TPR) repeat protein
LLIFVALRMQKPLLFLRVAVIALLSSFAARVQACGWSWETYAAEGESLPCVYDALLGYFPAHTPEYHEAVTRAVDYALGWTPQWTAGLDAKGLALMHLSRYPEAEVVMKQRLSINAEAYAAHANLGTLFTFTRQFPTALRHIDRAMALEPKAHFGREIYHRKLVVFLGDAQRDPNVALNRNFLDVAVDTDQRLAGSEAKYEEAGLETNAFDALVSMIAVYGAEHVAEIYLTLGDLLSLRGHSKLAWTAYKRALELDHPRKTELETWIAAMARRASVEPKPREPGDFRPGGHRGLPYAALRADAKRARTFYGDWERKQIVAGLPVWTLAGLEVLYAQMNRIRIRCEAPGIIDSQNPLDPAWAPKRPAKAPYPCPLCTWEGRARSVYGNAVVERHKHAASKPGSVP